MFAWLLVFHVIGFVIWVGSLLIVTHILAVQREEIIPEAREALGRLEMRVLKRLAHPGAGIVVITGLILTLINRFYYLRAGWVSSSIQVACQFGLQASLLAE